MFILRLIDGAGIRKNYRLYFSIFLSWAESRLHAAHGLAWRPGWGAIARCGIYPLKMVEACVSSENDLRESNLLLSNTYKRTRLACLPPFSIFTRKLIIYGSIRTDSI